MARTKSETHAVYRDEVAAYLRTVMAARGWKKMHVARELNVHHATILRAYEGTHDMQYPTLLALADHSGVPLPESLIRAATDLRMPTRPPPPPERVSAVVADILEKSEDEQREIYEELQRRFSRSS